MTDRSESIPLGGAAEPSGPPRFPFHRPILPEQLAFRQTFLWRFYQPEVIEAFRVVGAALFDLLNEAGAWGPSRRYPITHGELHAACDDLDHLAAYLDEVANERHTSELDPVAEVLAATAGGWSGNLSSLVADMRRALNEAVAVLDADPDAPQDPSERN